MPATLIIDGDAHNTSLDAQKIIFEKSLRDHLGGVSWVRLERRKQGLPKSNRRLPRGVLVKRGMGESDDELVTSVVAQVFDLIADDSQGAPWLGTALFMHEGPKGDEKLGECELRIDETDVPLTRDGAITELVAVMSKFAGDLCTQVVKIVGASAARESAIAELVSSVARSAGRTDRAEYRYKWKERKRELDIEEQKIHAESGVHRSNATKFAFAGLLQKYQPTFDRLARAWEDIQRARAGASPSSSSTTPEMPPRPTEAEVMQVFPESDDDDDALDDVRVVVLAMVRSTDATERSALLAKLVPLLQQLGIPRLAELQGAAEAKLGTKRVGEILAWVRNPWT